MTSTDHCLFTGLTELLPDLLGLYQDLHAHPELSFQEKRTAQVVAERLRTRGWEVTEGVGGTGVVGVLRNGEGPTVLLRADMDGLPVKEETGLPYASIATAVNDGGERVPVMHACGHDVHVTCLLGATQLLAANLDAWRGTVVAVFQPAEEVGGAPAMIEDGFLERFPRAEVCLGQHVAPVPLGYAGTRHGTVMAASDNLHVRLFGTVGHGSVPETTVDPVVMAAAIIMRLQTVVSREVGANQVAVVTVGAVEAGTKENVIPDTADLKINIRSAAPAVREKVIAAVKRVIRAEAMASAAPREPEIIELPNFPVTVNDPAATDRVLAAMSHVVGPERAFTLPQPVTGSEDFGTFGAALGVPSAFWFFGALDPQIFDGFRLADLVEGALPADVPGSHSSRFAPLPGPAIDTGVRLMLSAAAEWLIQPDAHSGAALDPGATPGSHPGAN